MKNLLIISLALISFQAVSQSLLTGYHPVKKVTTLSLRDELASDFMHTIEYAYRIDEEHVSGRVRYAKIEVLEMIVNGVTVADELHKGKALVDFIGFEEKNMTVLLRRMGYRSEIIEALVNALGQPTKRQTDYLEWRGEFSQITIEFGPTQTILNIAL